MRWPRPAAWKQATSNPRRASRCCQAAVAGRGVKDMPCLPPAEGGRHVSEDAVDDVGVVVDAELVGDGEQQGAGGCDRLVLLQPLDPHIRLGSIGAAKDRLGLRVDEPDLAGVLVPPAEEGPVPVIAEREDTPADRAPRLPLM